MGDILLTTAVVRALKFQVPDIEIHYLIRQKFAETIENNPYITRIIRVEKRAKEALGQIRAEKYDYIIDLHNNRRSRSFRRKCKIPSDGFPKLNFKKLILTKLKINLLPDIHIVHRYFAATKKFNIRYDGNGLDYFFPDEFSPTFELPEKPFLVVAIAGNYFTKRLPVAKIAASISEINNPVVLIGGPAEKEEADHVIELCGKNILNLCGSTSLSESAYVINKSAVVLCNDTGMMHLAAALKKPVVSTWGNTVPEFGMTPFFPDHLKKLSVIIEDKKIHCRPCSKLGYKKCPRGHFRCMMNLDTNIIVNEILKFLDKNQEPRERNSH